MQYKHDISCLSIFSFFVEFTLIFKVHVFNTLIAKKLDQAVFINTCAI